MRKLDGKGALSAPAVRATVATIVAFTERARDLKCNGIDLVATSAIRDATNRDDILRKIEDASGVIPRLISGDEEARLVADIILRTRPLPEGIVLDLGGGSMQLVHIRGQQVAETASLPLGCLRTTASFLLDDPPSAESLSRLRRHAVGLLRELPWFPNFGGPIIAAGGSARTVAKVARRAAGSPAPEGESLIDEDTVLDVYERLSRLAARDRAEVPGLPDHRVETIVAAALVFACVLRVAGSPTLLVSPHGIREALGARALLT